MENLSKIVISVDTGKKVGYVLDIEVNLINLEKIGYYVVDEETESEFELSCQDVLRVSEKFLFIESASKLQFLISRNSVFGMQVVDERGNDYGIVQSLEFQGVKCRKLITSRCEILVRYVTRIGQEIIFVRFGRKRKNSSRVKSSKIENFQRTAGQINVKIQNVSLLQRNMQVPTKLEKVVLSSDFYVGKTSTQDIFGYNNEKIVGCGQVISKAVVAKAKQHNKLNQLFFALKRDIKTY